MSTDRTGHAAIGAVDREWLDQVSPWLTGEDTSAITVLPRRITNGKAIYGDDIAPLVKWLRSEGVDARFLDTPDQTFESRYGAVSDILLSVLVSVGSNAAWDGFKVLVNDIRHRARDIECTGIKPQCRMSLGLRRYPDGSSLIWHEISGPAEEVLDFATSITRDYMAGNFDGVDAEIEGSAAANDPAQDAPE